MYKKTSLIIASVMSCLLMSAARANVQSCDNQVNPKYKDGRPAAKLRMDAKDQGIILRHGDGPDKCDIRGAREALIFKENDVYHLFYDGAGPDGWLACLATSKDLINWEKKGPVLDFGKPGEMDSAAACSPWVIHDGDEWHMFYLGTPNGRKVPGFPYLTLKAKSRLLAGPWVKQKDVVPFTIKPGTYYSHTASPGHVVKHDGEFLQFFSSTTKIPGMKCVQRTLGIARTKDLDGKWAVDPQPMVPVEEQVENTSLYYEKTNKTWFLFTNHIGIYDVCEYTDAIWVYWSKDLNKWDPANKAIVLDGKNCTWSKKCVGMPSVIKVGERLAVFYDAPGGTNTKHLNRNIGLAWLELPLTVPGKCVSSAEDIKVTDLRCEYLTSPKGIDITNPRLSWKLESDIDGLKQTAYRVIVSSSVDKLAKGIGDLWDSGKINSDQTNQIEYKGKPLESSLKCFWTVTVSAAGVNGSKPIKVESQSGIATWKMGLLNKSDWKGQWIGYDAIPEEPARKPIRNFNRRENFKPKYKTYLPSQYLRRDFNLSKEIVNAYLYVTAQGHVEMHLNGNRVGDEYFTPGWTDYRKRIYYRTYNVTAMLNKGSNAIGAILGDGWFRGNISTWGQNRYGKKLRLLSQLNIEYSDGSTETIASGPSWKASFGPIILSDMFEGETYDARKEITGWNKPGYNDQNWSEVNTGSDINPLIQAYPGVPIRPIMELPTIKLTEPKPGTWVFDLGQNFSGFARLKVKGNPGDNVHMQFAEMLNDDGTVYADNLRSAQAADNYIIKGTGTEIWQPHFTFHGYRYVEVTGLTEKPTKDTITGIVLHSDSPMTSSFECSNPMLNQLYSNVIWGQRSNYLEVPTDCPQRDERLGWTGDTQVFIRSGCYNQDVAAFFTKWMIDLMDTQNSAGSFGQQAPVFHGHGSPAWADAGVICPWTIYKIYGDKRIIADNYESMARFIRYCKSKGLKGKIKGFGDWLAVGSETPKDLISAAYFAYSTSLMAQIAEDLGKKQDAENYRKLFDEIAANFQKEFVKPDGTISGNSQTAYCLALKFNLLTEKQRKLAADHLVERIKAKNYHLSVGFVGVPILLPTLTEIGRTDLAYRLIQNRTYPSWGYSIDQGATTIWERWNSYTKKDGFGSVGMNSFNHYAYGSCLEWMFASMLGIDTDTPGFKNIIMKPQFGHGITWAKGHYDSINGRISSGWEIEDGSCKWNITIPPNTTAMAHIPGVIGTDSDLPQGATRVSTNDTNDGTVLKLIPGTYNLKWKIK